MKFENTEVFNFMGAIRGMRNPLESWNKSDSYMAGTTGFEHFKLGEKDKDLAQRLIKGGTEHRKFLRQIMVSVDITAPLYVWKEFDTYKVGTTANSTSTMHKLATTPITLDCFEIDDFDEYVERPAVQDIIEKCEFFRKKYLETNDKKYWKALIRWLPEGWLQTRTVTINYENLRNIYFQRRNHKLTEWHTLCDWMKSLPYAEELICYEG